MGKKYIISFAIYLKSDLTNPIDRGTIKVKLDYEVEPDNLFKAYYDSSEYLKSTYKFGVLLFEIVSMTEL